ncbi:hypothetical protein K432DRAFT_466675 [Lepidopterella palustris CBS 459.81]|uniref:Uncharacterized protein n=1 Tax=Lepidopterella palustris CBS 459.81 TaxID=1314670 RepID=A0A8E2JIQ0_9PEZI|nr:hypothetical protein K432DRAFT_466675 [Lepidopterella palustris CBS 459.81]
MRPILQCEEEYRGRASRKPRERERDIQLGGGEKGGETGVEQAARRAKRLEVYRSEFEDSEDDLYPSPAWGDEFGLIQVEADRYINSPQPRSASGIVSPGTSRIKPKSQ